MKRLITALVLSIITSFCFGFNWSGYIFISGDVDQNIETLISHGYQMSTDSMSYYRSVDSLDYYVYPNPSENTLDILIDARDKKVRGLTLSFLSGYLSSLEETDDSVGLGYIDASKGDTLVFEGIVDNNTYIYFESMERLGFITMIVREANNSDYDYILWRRLSVLSVRDGIEVEQRRYEVSK